MLLSIAVPISLAAAATPRVTVNATSVYSSGSTVRVAWDTLEGDQYWLGQFSPAVNSVNDVRMGGNPCPDVGVPPFTVPAPLKWISQPWQMRKMSWDFVVTNGRESINWVLFRGNLTDATAISVSTPVTFSDTSPMHVRLARTSSTAELRVSWTTRYDEVQAVKWGQSATALSMRTAASSTTYTAADLCGPPANASGWHEPGFLHEALLHLPPSAAAHSLFYYAVGSDAHGWSSVRSFAVPAAAAPHSSLRMLVLADMGVAYADGSAYHDADPAALNTSVHASRLLASRGGPGIDLAFHPGDLSYATGYLSEWDRFMEQIEPISAAVPYMTAFGNHERDYPHSGNAIGSSMPGWRPGTSDSGGECGVPTQARFHMPVCAQPNTSPCVGAPAGPHSALRTRRGGATPNMRLLGPVGSADDGWYSFEQGPVHFAVLNSEMNSSVGSRQHAFFSADLAAVNRNVTPWLVVLSHRHFYGCAKVQGPSCKYSEPQNLLDDMEELLYLNKADLVLYGHLHLAQRSCPMYRGKCVSSKDASGYDAPIHAIVGNAGMALNPFPDAPAPWSVYEGSEFGFSHLTAHNATHMTMDFLADAPIDQRATVRHSFTLQRRYPRVRGPPPPAPPPPSPVERRVTLSNLELPTDEDKAPILTGEAHVLAHGSSHYVYFNNWVGGCFCSMACTASAPPHCATAVCPRQNGTDPPHEVLVYETDDFVEWRALGVAYSPPDGASGGFVERPHVIFNPATAQFVLWHQRWHPDGGSSFAVATSFFPMGPFKLVDAQVNTTNSANDANVFVDADGVAYHISLQTLPCWPSSLPGRCAGLLLQKLTADFLSAAASTHFINISATGEAALEAPVLLKQGGWYYATAGTLSCAAAGGTAIYAFKSRSPLGPYTLAAAGNGQIFSRSASRAQASTAFHVGEQTVWLGNQWLTSKAPDQARNQDLLRWALLRMNDDGDIEPLEWEDSVEMELDAE
jgi:hypothetical protein